MLEVRTDKRCQEDRRGGMVCNEPDGNIAKRPSFGRAWLNMIRQKRMHSFPTRAVLDELAVLCGEHVVVLALGFAVAFQRGRNQAVAAAV